MMDERIGQNRNVGKYVTKKQKAKPVQELSMQRDHFQTQLIAISRLWMRRITLMQRRDMTISVRLEERAIKEIQDVEQEIREILSPFLFLRR